MINKDKSDLILKPKRGHGRKFLYDFRNNDEIELKFGSYDRIKIRPKKPNESTRILGAYFNCLHPWSQRLIVKSKVS